MQVKAVLFDQFKSNYYRMSQFKAEKTIRVLSGVIGAWREHAAYKKARNDKQEAFLEVILFKKYQRILVVWQ